MLDSLARWAPELPTRTPPRLYVALSWLIVAAGVGFYLINFLGGKTLWLDEAMVALNLRHLNWAELAGRLDYHQIAPIGWLYLQKAIYEQTGDLEYGLRAVSFVAASGALVVFRGLAFRVLDNFGALSAILLFALLGVLVRYAAEAKPYMVDVFLAVAAMAAAAALMRQHERRAWIALALVGFATVFLSFAAVYVLAAGACAVFLFMLAHRRWRGAVGIVALSALWLSVFLALFVWLYRPQLVGSELVEGGSHNFFVRTAFAPVPPTSLGELLWYPKWIEHFLEFLFHAEGFVAAAVLIALGAYVVLRRSLPLLVIVLGPLAIAFLASSFQVYPLFDRLVLFLASGFFICMGAAADWLRDRAHGAIAPAAALVLVVAIGSTPYIVGNLGMNPPFQNQDILPALDVLKRDIKPGDRLYVSNMTVPAYMLYHGQAGLAGTPWTPGRVIQPVWPCILQDMPTAAPGDRLWVLMVSNAPDDFPIPEQLSDVLAARGAQPRLIEAAAGQNMKLFRLDLLPLPNATLRTVPRQGCWLDVPNNRFDPPPRLAARVAANP